MAVIGELATLVTARTAPFTRAMAGVRSSTRSTRGSLDRFGKSALGLTAALTGAASAGGLLINSLRLAANAEQAEVAFGTLLGSAEKAKVLLEDIRNFAASTPFQFEELVDASRKLVAFGFSAREIIPTMRRLGDISAGTGNRISEIAEIFGKARVQGRLFGEDINQLTGRGIPVISALADVMGTTEGNVKSLVSAGKVGFGELQKAFASVTTEGSQFGGMMEAQSDTTAGAFSTLKDALSAVQLELGRTVVEVTDLTNSLKGFTEYVDTTGERWQASFFKFRSMLATIPLVFYQISDAMADTVSTIDTQIQAMFGRVSKNVFGFSNSLEKMRKEGLVDLEGNVVRQGPSLMDAYIEGMREQIEKDSRRAQSLIIELENRKRRNRGGTPDGPDSSSPSAAFGGVGFMPFHFAEAIADAINAVDGPPGPSEFMGVGLMGVGFASMADQIAKAAERANKPIVTRQQFGGAAAKGSTEAARIIAGLRNDPQLKELEKIAKIEEESLAVWEEFVSRPPEFGIVAGL